MADLSQRAQEVRSRSLQRERHVRPSSERIVVAPDLTIAVIGPVVAADPPLQFRVCGGPAQAFDFVRLRMIEPEFHYQPVRVTYIHGSTVPKLEHARHRRLVARRSGTLDK